MTVTIETDDEGRRIASKWASTADDLARLRREAEMLTAAQHPGIVELLDVEFTDGRGVLRMAAISGTPIGRFRSLDESEVAGVVAALASTISDLHLMGVVHRNVDRDSVLIDHEGRPVLTAFGEARAIEDADPAEDVCGLGQLLIELAGTGRGPRLEVLRALGAWATSADPTDRPSAGQLSASLLDRIPGARLATGDGPDPRPNQSGAGFADRESSRWRTRAGLAMAAFLVIATVVVVRQGGGSQPDRTALVSPTPKTTASHQANLECRGPGADPADIGCPARFTIANGVVSDGSRRWQVGQPTDLAAIASWGCRSDRTVVVVQPDSGWVWTFDQWAEQEPLSARPLGRVDGATGIAARDTDGDGCLEAAVQRRGAEPTTFRVEEVAP